MTNLRGFASVYGDIIWFRPQINAFELQNPKIVLGIKGIIFPVTLLIIHAWQTNASQQYHTNGRVHVVLSVYYFRSIGFIGFIGLNNDK